MPLRGAVVSGVSLWGKVMRISVLVISALALSTSTFAAEAPQEEVFTTLFATTCMQHFYGPDNLRAAMSSQNAAVLQGEAAEFFLGGKPGTAWSVRISDGRYVVSWRDDNVCTVFAQRAPVADVHTNFISLVSTAPEPLIASPRDSDGPNTELLKSIAYGWHHPRDKTELLFALTTSTDAAPAVQVMASMAIVNKPNSSKAKPLRGSP